MSEGPVKGLSEEMFPIIARAKKWAITSEGVCARCKLHQDVMEDIWITLLGARQAMS